MGPAHHLSNQQPRISPILYCKALHQTLVIPLNWPHSVTKLAFPPLLPLKVQGSTLHAGASSVMNPSYHVLHIFIHSLTSMPVLKTHNLCLYHLPELPHFSSHFLCQHVHSGTVFLTVWSPSRQLAVSRLHCHVFIFLSVCLLFTQLCFTFLHVSYIAIIHIFNFTFSFLLVSLYTSIWLLLGCFLQIT